MEVKECGSRLCMDQNFSLNFSESSETFLKMHIVGSKSGILHSDLSGDANVNGPWAMCSVARV